MFDPVIVKMLAEGFLETLYMTFVSSAVAYLLGLPLGIVLVVTDKGGIRPIPWLNWFLGVVINLLRSVPFLFC